MSNGGLPIETLRLNGAEKQKLIEYVEKLSKQPFDDERRGLRVMFDGRKVLVKVIGAEGRETVCTVVPRNLSRRGLAFVHGRFIYPDSECEVTLPILSGKWAVLKGVIRRCRHVSGIVHEVSVVFDETLDLKHFVRLNAEQAERHLEEMTADGLGDQLPAGTRGRALVVDHLTADRRLFRMWMEKLRFEVDEAQDVATTIRQLNKRRYDVYLIDTALGDDDGVELIEHLRKQGIIAPIISTSVDSDGSLMQRLSLANASAILTKPLAFEPFRQTVLETVSLGGDPQRVGRRRRHDTVDHGLRAWARGIRRQAAYRQCQRRLQRHREALRQSQGGRLELRV